MIKYLVILMLIFFLLKTIFPTIPSLDREIELCKKEIDFGWKFDEVDNLLISECKEKISVLDIFKAKYLTVSLSSNNSFTIVASLTNKKGDLLTLTPQTVDASPYLKVVNFNLERARQYPKLNKLLTGSNGVKFIITDIKDQTDLKVVRVLLE